jgi:hypothetical protein
MILHSLDVIPYILLNFINIKNIIDFYISHSVFLFAPMSYLGWTKEESIGYLNFSYNILNFPFRVFVKYWQGERRLVKLLVNVISRLMCADFKVPFADEFHGFRSLLASQLF